MKKISLLFYAVKQGIKNIYRNRMFSMASIGTIMACLFLFGIFYFVLSNFQYMIKNAETSVGLTVFFEEGITDERVEEIGKEIQQRTEIESIYFVSAEEAWSRLQKKIFDGKKELTETFLGDNPLKESASYEVYLNDISKQNEVVKYIEGLDGVRQVNNSDIIAKGLTSFNSLVGYISAAIIIILIAVAVFLISTTVTMGINVRREEIGIMRLIGATDFFIRAPFIVEGMIISLIGTGIPLVILYFIYNKVIAYITMKFKVLTGLLTFLNVNDVFRMLVPIAFCIGIGIGLLGSYLTVRKHLNV